MIVHVPSHLRQNIPIIDQMAKLIEEYTKQFGNESSLGSFDYYYSYYSIDPVKRFIELCLDPDDYEEESYNDIVSYLVKRFYSVKGTSFVFDYMEKYLDFNFTKGYHYSVNEIIFEIDEVKTTDLAMYIKSLKEFLSALLYYGDLAATIRLAELSVEETISSYIDYDFVKFREFEAVEFNP